MPRIRLGPPSSDDIKVAEIYGYMTVDTQGKTLKEKKNLAQNGKPQPHAALDFHHPSDGDYYGC
jgi:hypothetical protein